MKVHLLHAPEPEELAFLRSSLNPLIQLRWGEIATQRDVDILVGGRPSREQIEACRKLQTLVIPFAGIPPQTRTLMLEFPEIAVYNLHHNAGTTAETALALLFAAAKFVVPFDNDLRRHDWTRRYQPNPSLLLAGKTVLILGFGAIGQHVGRVCHALGMTVIGVRRRVGNLPELGFPAVVHPMADLLDLLGRTQVLVIALPGTPETDGLVDETALRALPRGAVLVNIGRGAVVDSGAMYRALVDGHLRAAGLDVWYHYPDSAESRTHTPPADFPFHELDNVVLSPHRGGATEETESLRMQALAEMLNAAAEGRPLPGRVDVRAGY